MLLVVVLVAVAGRVLLAAAVIAGAQWTVITYWPQNTTLVLVVLVVPALLAGYTLADALTGSTGLGTAGPSSRRDPAMSAEHGWLLIAAGIGSALVGTAMLSASRRRIDAPRTRVVGLSARLTGALTCTSYRPPWSSGCSGRWLSAPALAVLWAAARGVPALLAGATVTRLYAAARAMRDRKRRARAFRRGIECADD